MGTPPGCSTAWLWPITAIGWQPPPLPPSTCTRFFYDAQDGDPAHKGHWTRHPAIALENAQKELLLTGIETDIIRSHMFPLTLRPPHFRESALVSLMDKACSVYEFFRRKDPYRSLRSVLAGLPVHPVLCPQATEA